MLSPVSDNQQKQEMERSKKKVDERANELQPEAQENLDKILNELKELTAADTENQKDQVMDEETATSSVPPDFTFSKRKFNEKDWIDESAEENNVSSVER